MLTVTLDDHRCLEARHSDLLAVLADLAQGRAVVDEACLLLLDPLACPQEPGSIVLLVRAGLAGAEVGLRHTTDRELENALCLAWDDVDCHARRTGDQALLEELLVPHAEHYWPLSPHSRNGQAFGLEQVSRG